MELRLLSSGCTPATAPSTRGAGRSTWGRAVWQLDEAAGVPPSSHSPASVRVPFCGSGVLTDVFTVEGRQEGQEGAPPGARGLRACTAALTRPSATSLHPPRFQPQHLSISFWSINPQDNRHTRKLFMNIS